MDYCSGLIKRITKKVIVINGPKLVEGPGIHSGPGPLLKMASKVLLRISHSNKIAAGIITLPRASQAENQNKYQMGSDDSMLYLYC